MREGLAAAPLRRGLGCCGSRSLSGRTFGERKGLLHDHTGAGAEGVMPAGALPGHLVPPS